VRSGDPTFDPNYTFGCGLGNAVPYSQFGNIQNINDIGSARYDSIQVKAEKPYRHGMYALLSYTYARAFDSGFSDGLGTTTGATYFPLPGTSKGDWALSQIHLNHNFTASLIYDLPFGKGKRYGSSWSGPVNGILGDWQINVIEKITSGFPIFIITSNNTTGISFANNGSNAIRPNQVCSGRLSHPTPDKYFDQACFVARPMDNSELRTDHLSMDQVSSIPIFRWSSISHCRFTKALTWNSGRSSSICSTIHNSSSRIVT